MSQSDRIGRSWTHRRLGIGAEQIGEVASAETDAMLTRVGARATTTTSAFFDSDPFSAALLDFAWDIDRTAGIAAVDATPVASELLRLSRVSGRSRRPTSRVMIPAMSGSMAAVVVVLTLLLDRSSSAPVVPSLSVTAESQQLLHHANTLLSVAATAAPDQRTRLVTEAKADLTHVTRLLPLAPPPARSGIRQRLHTLNRQMRPLAPPPPTRKPSQGATTESGSGTGNADRSSGNTGGAAASPERRKSGSPNGSTGPAAQESSPLRPPRPGSGQLPPPQGDGAQGGPGRLPPPTGQAG